jgi:excisionase family DNA binding protein
MSETAPDPWLRPSVAARRLGITMQTLRRWMSKGVIAYSLVGPNRFTRFRQSEVDQHVVNVPRSTIGNISNNGNI